MFSPEEGCTQGSTAYCFSLLDEKSIAPNCSVPKPTLLRALPCEYLLKIEPQSKTLDSKRPNVIVECQLQATSEHWEDGKKTWGLSVLIETLDKKVPSPSGLARPKEDANKCTFLGWWTLNHITPCNNTWNLRLGWLNSAYLSSGDIPLPPQQNLGIKQIKNHLLLSQGYMHIYTHYYSIHMYLFKDNLIDMTNKVIKMLR